MNKGEYCGGGMIDGWSAKRSCVSSHTTRKHLGVERGVVTENATNHGPLLQLGVDTESGDIADSNARGVEESTGNPDDNT